MALTVNNNTERTKFSHSLKTAIKINEIGNLLFHNKHDSA